MQKYGFGVDIGGTSCKLGLFTVDGEMLEKWEIPTVTTDNGTHILENVARTITGKMQERHMQKNEIVGIGLDVPGPVGKDEIVSQCVNLGWRNYPAAEILQERMDMKVRICNDANAAALGEMWKGGGRGHTDVVMITLGTGVGGAVILDGKIIPGVHGLCGELGHITVYPEEKAQCNCGKHGCLEQYASATGISRITRELLAKKEKPSRLQKVQNLSAKKVLDAAKEGDAVALEAVDILGKALGRILAATSHVIDPEIYVIGGGVSRAGEILITATKKYFEKEVLPAGRQTEFALATLENDAGMYGAMKLLLD